MSFRLFIYYCAVCGGWAALVGWLLGLLLVGGEMRQSDDPGKLVLASVLLAAGVGVPLALGLAVVDGLWNLSSKQAGRVALRGLAGAGIGLAATLPGAVLGQVLVNATGAYGLAIVGWALTGTLIGMSVGVCETLARLLRGEQVGGAGRKVLHGTLGGLLGGFLGGGLWVLFNTLLRFGDKSGGVLGFVALGTCIGLFVGLAQVILKEAWLRVEAGFRPGRELILSKEETTIGRAESCDVGLFGDNTIEKLHARILHKGHRYLLDDADTPHGTYLNDRRIGQPTPLKSGDKIRVGKSVICFSERQKRTGR